jgi:hypothetical protein
MIIRFSIKQDDFDSLIEPVAEEDANASSALRCATRAGQRSDGQRNEKRLAALQTQS